MNIYQDEFITFTLPNNLMVKSIKRERNAWNAITKKMVLLIIVEYNDPLEWQHTIKSCHERATNGLIADGPHKMTINGYETDYCFLIREIFKSPGKFGLLSRFSITTENYVLYIEIGPTDEFDTRTFPMNEYMPFISSIRVHNFEGLKQMCDEIDRKNEIKYSKQPQPIPVDIPQDFKEFPSPIPMQGGRLFKKEGFEIHIINLTGIGREADIDIFKENLKEGEKIEDTRLWDQLNGKKCLVQNLDGTPLDFLSCKDIEVLLAFRGKCFSVSMKSTNPFDLNEYKTFLDSIGTKMKKASKNK